MQYAIDNQIPGDLTIHSDAQAAISRLGIQEQALAKTELSELYRPYSAGSGKAGVPGLNGSQRIPELLEMRGPISSSRWRGSFRETTGANVYCMAQRTDLTAFYNGKGF
jgi:hypothetical protein